MVAEVEVTRLASDRSGRSFMISAPAQDGADRDTGGGLSMMPHRHVARRPKVLYYYLRDRDLAAAVGKLECLSRLLSNGTSPFMAAGTAR